MTTYFDIVIPGHYFYDVIFTGLPAFPSLGYEIFSGGVQVMAGGGALNSAIGLIRLGVKVGWAGALGNDFFSQFIESYIINEGLDTSLIQRLDAPLQRVTVALSYPTDRAFVSYVEQPPDVITLTQKALEQASCKHLHFSSLVIHEALPELLKACKKTRHQQFNGLPTQ